MSLQQAREVLEIEQQGIAAVIEQLDHNFEQAVELIMACPSRVIITGIGKSGLIGQKISATFNSTGTTSFFLHPVEAMHGDLGIVDPRDVVLAISYSGETAELNLLLPTLIKRGVGIIAMTGGIESTLAKAAKAVLNVAVPREACPLGLAPTASTTAALAMGDALAVVLLERKQFKASDFHRNHPGGSLGERLKVKVSEVMLTGGRFSAVLPGTSLAEAVRVMDEKNLGVLLVMGHKNEIIGILTDGDIRRLVVKSADIFAHRLEEVITPTPKTIHEDQLAADALSIMQHYEVTTLPVKNNAGQITGVLHLHDLLGKGEFRVLV